MRKASLILLVFCLLESALLAPLAGAERRTNVKKSKRTVTDTYESPAFVTDMLGPQAPGAYVCTHGGEIGNIGCVSFPVKPSERFIEVEIADASGLPAPAYVSQEDVPTYEAVCGKTTQPLRIVPGIAVEIWVYPVDGEPICPGVGTRGTITATFSNRP